MPTQVDGFNEDVDIANWFADKHRTLFNSVKSDHGLVNQIRDHINNRVKCEAPNDVMFTLNDIFTAVGNLNSKKHDGYRGTYSDHFMYTSHKHLVVMSVVINGVLVHGYNANDLWKSIFLSDTDSYRGVALCSAICKIIDYAITH